VKPSYIHRLSCRMPPHAIALISRPVVTDFAIRVEVGMARPSVDRCVSRRILLDRTPPTAAAASASIAGPSCGLATPDISFVTTRGH
jgi:hypothetical protein